MVQVLPHSRLKVCYVSSCIMILYRHCCYSMHTTLTSTSNLSFCTGCRQHCQDSILVLITAYRTVLVSQHSPACGSRVEKSRMRLAHRQATHTLSAAATAAKSTEQTAELTAAAAAAAAAAAVAAAAAAYESRKACTCSSPNGSEVPVFSIIVKEAPPPPACLGGHSTP